MKSRLQVEVEGQRIQRERFGQLRACGDGDGDDDDACSCLI